MITVHGLILGVSHSMWRWCRSRPNLECTTTHNSSQLSTSCSISYVCSQRAAFPTKCIVAKLAQHECSTSYNAKYFSDTAYHHRGFSPLNLGNSVFGGRVLWEVYLF